ncbi:AraC-like DNA-binding protein [Paenibacillus endophyticus]|uniref:AraC-like DNA-binding protein n=1 Tax=Paenibacillus endophyticus TaxID=1294268 RepID=A0A7W5CE70_9BACL|nr:helix-turn-helix domain-containing protein [Paenibacillus endophyticus]MBB3155594.1 AraC-like DNA-binding protein [Paenibacillus endophyticus]
MHQFKIKANTLTQYISKYWSQYKSRLLFKYAASYIFMFLVPLTVVTIFIYENAAYNLRSEIERANLNQLTQVKLTIDGHMSDLYEIASRISYDEHLTPYMMSDPYRSREGINTLASYTANSSIVEQLFLYYHDRDEIYSYEGMTNPMTLFNKVYIYHNWSSAGLLKALNDSTAPLIRPAEPVSIYSREEALLTLLIPIKPSDPYPYGSVMFLLKEAKITGLMDTILNQYKGNSYILSPTGEVLTSNTNGTALSREALTDIAELETGIHSIRLDGETQSVVAVKSTENGWSYATTMPTYQFFESVVHIKTLIMLVFTIAALTGIVVAIILARRQYHPIKNLIDFARLQTGSRDEALKVRNEWEWITQTFRDYKARIHWQTPFVRNQCLMLLLKHGKPNDPEIERMIMETGLEPPNAGVAYFTAVLSWDSPPEDEPRQPDHMLQLELLSQLSFPELEIQVYGVEFSVRDRFALMVLLPDQEPERQEAAINSLFENIRALLLEQTDALPHIGVGTIYPSLSKINQSFIEASTALDYRQPGEPGITFFDHLQNKQAVSQATFWLSKKTILRLEQSLKQGNEPLAQSMLAGMVQEIKQESLSVPILRLICFDILNTMLRTAADLDMGDVFGRVPALASFDTLEEFENKLAVLAGEVCRQVNHQTETSQPSLIDDLVAYVDQNFADYTLSLEHIALRFSVSTSYLSRSFKEKMGMNFTHYIWLLRMNEVKRLLIVTNDPLQIIIERVGYLDAPNFIRKFKKDSGLTPGQFRKQHCQSNTPSY